MSMEFVESNQKVAVNLAMGLIAWVFGVVLFLPLTLVYAPDWGSLVALLLIVDIGYYLMRVKLHSGPLFEYTSRRLADIYVGWRKLDDADLPAVMARSRKVLGVGLILVVYLMYRPLLWAVSPILAGVAFIIALLFILKQLLEQRYSTFNDA